MVKIAVIFLAIALCMGTPERMLAQQKAKDLVAVAPELELAVARTAVLRSDRVLVGALIGGTIGAAVAAGCLLLHGMAAPVALPYCVIPIIVGAGLGAWIGAGRGD